MKLFPSSSFHLFITICFLTSSETQPTTFEQSIQILPKGRILQSKPTCFTPLPSSTSTNAASLATESSSSRPAAPIVGSTQNSRSLSPPSEITTKYDEFILSFKPPSSPEWGSSQYSYRNLIYQSNLQKINEHNKKGEGYYMGINIFCDLTQLEFNALYSKLIIPDEIKKVTYGLRENIKNGIKNTFGDEYGNLWDGNLESGTSPAVTVANKNREKNLRTQESSSSSSPSSSTIPPKNIASAATQAVSSIVSTVTPPIIGSTSSFLNAFATLTIPSSSASTPVAYTTPEQIKIDWSCKASAIINQGICGSCFAIAPLETIFMTLKIYNRTILPLSIQEILSCTDSSNGAFGCGGGYFLSSYEYVRVNGTGRALLYPYNTRATNEGVATACNQTLINSQSYNGTKFRIRESGFIPFNDCAELVKRLKVQPIAVSIATTNFQYYINGTYDVLGEMPNHGVVLVGYDPEKGYKIKNSWGSTWGDAGYGYVSKNTGVCDYSMYPITGFEGTGNRECC